jgi:hypothetical protein
MTVLTIAALLWIVGIGLGLTRLIGSRNAADQRTRKSVYAGLLMGIPALVLNLAKLEQAPSRVIGWLSLTAVAGCILAIAIFYQVFRAAPPRA